MLVGHPILPHTYAMWPQIAQVIEFATVSWCARDLQRSSPRPLMATGHTLLALSELLKPPGSPQEEEEEELEVRPSAYATPGSIGPVKSVGGGRREERKGKEIWDEGEVSEQQQFEYEDPRPQPEYEMVFKQTVTAEDVFLGMGNKTPATASCEHLTVKIKLPDTEFKDVELDVTETFLDCRTPKLRLGLHLPHKVNSQRSRAQWHSDQGLLEVTLRLNREYDFINQ